jgi:hypothetical protein
MGMKRDAQRGRQDNVHKTHTGPRIDDYLERLGLVAPQQGGMERGQEGGEATLSLRPTRVLISTNELGLLKGQVDTVVVGCLVSNPRNCSRKATNARL